MATSVRPAPGVGWSWTDGSYVTLPFLSVEGRVRYPMEPGMVLERHGAWVWLPLREWTVTVEADWIRLLGEYEGRPCRVSYERRAVRGWLIADSGDTWTCTPV